MGVNDSLPLVNDSLLLVNHSFPFAKELLHLTTASLLLVNQSLPLASASLQGVSRPLHGAGGPLRLANKSLQGANECRRGATRTAFRVSVAVLQRTVQRNVWDSFVAGAVGVLELVESPVEAVQGEQFLVRALFAQFAVVHDDDAVGALDG